MGAPVTGPSRAGGSQLDPRGVAVPILNVTPTLPYRVRLSFFSRSEGVFYRTLKGAVGGRYLIFANVRIADICADLDPPDQAALNRIWSRHVDFVLCEPTSFAIVAAIELDGRSHDNPQQKAKDQFKDAVFKRIGVPLLRYPAEAQPTSAQLVHSIDRVLRIAS